MAQTQVILYNIWYNVYDLVLLPLHNSLSSSDLSLQLSYPSQTTESLIHFTGLLNQSWHLKCPSSHTLPITEHWNVFANRSLLVLLTVSKQLKYVILNTMEHLRSPPIFSGVCVTRSLVLCVCFVDHCLFICTFFFWALCSLFFFDIRILITILVSSNFSYQ